MTDFLIRVIVDPGSAVKGTRRVRDELENTERASDRLGASLRRAFTVAAVALAGRAVAGLTDEYTNLQNRLRTVVSGQDELTQATERLFTIADETRSVFSGTAELYARLALATKELAVSDEELLTVTKGINQAIILSGASAAEAQAGLIQLSQGLASGALRGDELRSVLEQLPAVADVIAKGLGVTRGELRKLGEEGRITAEAVIGSFLEASEQLESNFAKTVPTIGQSLVVLRNNVLSSVGSFDQATGASEALSSSILGLAENLDTLVNVAVVAGGTLLAIQLAPLAVSAASAASAYIGLRAAVATGSAVLLGSAEATRQQTVAAGLQAKVSAEAAKAEIARTAAVEASILADRQSQVAQADSLKVRTAALAAQLREQKLNVIAAQAKLAEAAAEKARTGTGVSSSLQRVVATGNLTAAEKLLAKANAEVAITQRALTQSSVQLAAVQQASTGIETRLAATRQASAAAAAQAAAAQTAATNAVTASTIRATIAARALSLINPFTVAVTGAVALGLVLNELIGDLEKTQQKVLEINEAGEKFALTGFAQVGAEILTVQKNLARVQAEIDRDLTTKGAANPVALAKAEEYRTKLAQLTTQQELLANGTAKTTVQAREQQLAIEALARGLDEVIASIEQENQLLALNSREREIQTALLREVAKLEKGGQKVSAEQKAELDAALRRNQALKEQAEVLERINGPQEEFRAQVAALKANLDADKISLEQFNAELGRLVEGAKGIDLSSIGAEGLGLDPGALDSFIAKAEASLKKGQLAPQAPDALAPFVASPSDGSFDALAQAYDNIKGPQAQFAQTQAALKQLLDASAISAEEYAFALNSATVAANTASSSASQGLAAGLAQVENQLRDVSGAVATTVVNAFGAAEDAIVQFATTGEVDFSAFVDSLLADVARILARKALLTLIESFAGGDSGGGGGGGGGGAGLIGSLLSAFGGGKEEGGPVKGGTTYLVGEGGPELFTPPSAGQITPAGKTAALMQPQAAAAPIVNVAAPNISITNVSDPSEIPSGIESPEGVEAVLNVVSRNRRKFRAATS